MAHIVRGRVQLLATRVRRRCFGGVGISEDKIKAWLRQGGDQAIASDQHGKPLRGDRHAGLASSLGLKDDYVHGKILKDNNILPKSVECRRRLDRAWAAVQQRIRSAAAEFDDRPTNKTVAGTESAVTASAKATTSAAAAAGEEARAAAAAEAFLRSAAVEAFRGDLERLDAMARETNDAILEDSLRFNGKSPVAHARRFSDWAGRIREALLQAPPAAGAAGGRGGDGRPLSNADIFKW